MNENTHIFGAFKTVGGARHAIETLVDEGIPKDAIGMLVSDAGRKKLGTVESHTKAPEGAAAGGIAGGVLGGLIAGLSSIAAGVFPGVALLAAGPIMAVLAGAGAGAAAGGTIGGVVGLAMNEHELKRYSEVLREDGVLVTVSTDDRSRAKSAREVLRAAGALDIDTARGQTAHL
jgi:hypothetical protein